MKQLVKILYSCL